MLKRFGEPLAIETLPDPGIGTGEVLVDVVATSVLPYSADIFRNARRYDPVTDDPRHGRDRSDLTPPS